MRTSGGGKIPCADKQYLDRTFAPAPLGKGGKSVKFEDTLYEVLEVSPRASTDVIKAAYRCLAQHHHPDKNAGTDTANHTLAQINHAYSILSDPVARLSYDRKIGLRANSHERRGVPAEADGHYGSVAAGQSVSRPFGFHPL